MRDVLKGYGVLWGNCWQRHVVYDLASWHPCANGRALEERGIEHESVQVHAQLRRMVVHMDVWREGELRDVVRAHVAIHLRTQLLPRPARKLCVARREGQGQVEWELHVVLLINFLLATRIDLWRSSCCLPSKPCRHQHICTMPQCGGRALGDSITLTREVLHLLVPPSRADESQINRITFGPTARLALRWDGIQNSVEVRPSHVHRHQWLRLPSLGGHELLYLSKLLKSRMGVFAPDLGDG
mmetsp:Transcript_110033/g.275611  ORF Transcript_110033/g.275611 Transcript_110033/m.275611 type:complete len:242 (-) Transcript_110033:666-1391(-)